MPKAVFDKVLVSTQAIMSSRNVSFYIQVLIDRDIKKQKSEHWENENSEILFFSSKYCFNSFQMQMCHNDIKSLLLLILSYQSPKYWMVHLENPILKLKNKNQVFL